MLQRIEIEDTSDCETCTARETGTLEYLAEVKCTTIDNVQCQECGREHHIWIPEEESEAVDGE